MRRDLEAVADLVELCFSDTLDLEGRNFLRGMRETARSASLMGWTDSLIDHSPTPQTGLVWEQDERLIGNVSLIPITVSSRRCYLIANVAVHPEFRGQGIGRQLTFAAMEFARSRHVPAVWLQVRDDNPSAIHIYRQLSFIERARRTTWRATDEIPHLPNIPGISLSRRRTNFWPAQQRWLERVYPLEFYWNLPVERKLLRPDFWGMTYRLMSLDYPRQWAVLRYGKLQGVITWRHISDHNDPLWLAIPDPVDEEALFALLVYARGHIPRRQPISLNLNTELAKEPLQRAGFRPAHTLIWMEYKF
jgi:GNAT superfamily N-acetyltransferase